jgi:hypothetical protein
MFFTGEARNAQGLWQLGNKNSFACSAAPKVAKVASAAASATATSTDAADCQFNALDDQQERARYGLLDWNVRTSLNN